MTDTWTTNPDGSVDFNGTVRFAAGTNLASGVGVVIFGPNGAVANFGAVAEGAPGLSPLIDVAYVELDPSDPLPSPNPAVTVLDPGASGTRRHESWIFYGHKGDAGVPGNFLLAAAADLSGTPNVGYFPAISGADPTVFTLVPQKVGELYPGSVSTLINVNGNRTLSTINIAPRPFDRRAICKALVTITGTPGTQVDLAAALNAIDGDQIGRGFGVVSTGAAQVTALKDDGIGVLLDTGVIPAGTGATVFLRSVQIDTTGGTYSVDGSRSSFSTKVDPIP